MDSLTLEVALATKGRGPDCHYGGAASNVACIYICIYISQILYIFKWGIFYFKSRVINVVSFFYIPKNNQKEVIVSILAFKQFRKIVCIL